MSAIDLPTQPDRPWHECDAGPEGSRYWRGEGNPPGFYLVRLADGEVCTCFAGPAGIEALIMDILSPQEDL